MSGLPSFAEIRDAAARIAPHALVTPGESTCNPAGSGSVKATPVIVPNPGFEMVKLKLVVPFNGMFDLPKALLIARVLSM